MKIIRWIARIVLFILVIVLVLQNRHIVQFNLYGIYIWNLPIIVLCFIFLLIGLTIGLGYSFIQSIKLKSKIRSLKHNLDGAKKSS